MKLIAFLLFIFSWSTFGYEGVSNLPECQMHQKHFKRDNLKVICGDYFHQYLASDYENLPAPEKLKIGGFNLWNIGSPQTKFKDLTVLAKIIDQWDIVAVVELLPIIGADLKTNNDIFEFRKNILSTAQEKVRYYERKVEEHKKKHEKKPAGTPKGFFYLRAEKKLAEYESDFQEKLEQSQEMENMIRSAGYFKLLKHLQVLNPEAGWSLILTNEMMGASSLKELSGFFFKRSLVKPIKNEYCSELRGRNLEGCLPLFSDDNEKSFSRKPFIASFRSGKFDFVLLTSHVRFNPPQESWVSQINNIFESREVRGSKVNLARLKEVILTGKLMNKMRLSFKEKDLFLIGDLNLSTKQINDAIESFSEIEGINGWKVLNDELSSISDHSGLKSNYDHVIYHQEETRECYNKDGELGDMHVETLNFTDKKFHSKFGLDEYKVFENGQFQEDKVSYLIEKYKNSIKDNKTLKRGKIVAEYPEDKVTMMGNIFSARVLKSQNSQETPFKWLKQVVSDHLPVHFECSTEEDDD